ncbi:glycerol-3-phosphate 1-O-acyltransferase PlsB [uncultured Umboniibacter sp.]|uniref:glycerol-3-phosphate 1-O-acyltransferase PlsB n=1 Tax=uncultured Umboniibacter sp. TaxID=1798917 RepID=UPI00260807D9|nr:glycerol-3-phosphate 1-O-acyltransferase PlsB [uncultured Umboniibacter sp.]
MKWLTLIHYRIASIIRFWIRPTVLPNELDDVQDELTGDIYYVLHDHSFTDLVAAQQAIKSSSLPAPASRDHWYALTEKTGSFFARRHIYDANQAGQLIQRARAGQVIQFVPLSIFWGRAPKREQSFWRLLFSYNNYELGGGIRKFLATIAARKDLEIHVSKPLSLNALVSNEQNNEISARKLHRVLRVHYRQVKTAVVGPDLSHRRTVVRDLVKSRAVQQVIDDKIKNGDSTREQLEAKAQKYGNEIASSYNTRAIRILDKFLTRFWNKVYDGVEVEGIDRVKELAGTHAIVYLPCHRSHIDYLLLSYALFKQGLAAPHIAAGINLNLPIVGRLLRGAGAFFIRRKFRGEPLYSAVFNEYLHTLLRRGFPVEFFIEGGRSRTGRSLPPKTGMIALMLRSYLRDHSKPIAIVPIYVGYEKVLEGNTYLGELRGKRKKSESIFGLFKVVKTLKGEFGKVRANFGEPLCLDNFLDERQPDWRKAASDKPDWLPELTNELADEAIKRINESAHVNRVSLVAAAILCAPRQALGDTTLLAQIDFYKELLKAVPYSAETTFDDHDALGMVDHCEKLGFTEKRIDSMGAVYHLSEVNSVLLTYYRNNIQHLLVIPSLLAYALNNMRGIGRESLIQLVNSVYPYLKKELYLNLEDYEVESAIEAHLTFLLEHGILTTEGTIIRGAEPGSNQQLIQRLLAAHCQPMLERFYIVLSLIRAADQQPLSTKLLEQKSVDVAQRLSMIHGIHSPEFFDKRLFAGFIEQLYRRKVIQDDEGFIRFGQPLTDILLLAERVMSVEVVQNLRLAKPQAELP